MDRDGPRWENTTPKQFDFCTRSPGPQQQQPPPPTSRRRRRHDESDLDDAITWSVHDRFMSHLFLTSLQTPHEALYRNKIIRLRDPSCRNDYQFDNDHRFRHILSHRRKRRRQQPVEFVRADFEPIDTPNTQIHPIVHK
jgi:hypothetical protein